MRSDRFDLNGIPIDFLDLDAVVERALEAGVGRRFLQIATVNLDFLVNSQRDDEVRTILTSTDINIPDGAPVVWAGKLLGRQNATRIAGADLVPALIAAAAREHRRVFLLGGENDSAAVAAERLVEQHPDLEISVFEPPRSSLEAMDDAKILRHIDAAAPHILLVAFGHPKQDKWIYRNRHSLPMAALGVGCSLDLIAGRHARAPRWMQSAGLEWAYRLANEPRRLGRRYANDALWVARDLAPWLVSQRYGHGATSAPAPRRSWS